MDKMTKVENMQQEIERYSDPFAPVEVQEFMCKLGMQFAEDDVEELYNETYFQPVLFHGTDKRIMAMDKEEREFMHKAYIRLRDYLVSVYVRNGFDKIVWDLPRIQKMMGSVEKGNELSICFSEAKGGMEGNKNYSYGNLYLTNMFSRAKSYAEKAHIFGEIGYLDSVLLDGCETLGYELEDMSLDICGAINCLREAMTYEPQPVIYMYAFVKRDVLYMEKGNEILDFEGRKFFGNGKGSYYVPSNYKPEKKEYCKAIYECGKLT